MGKLYCPVDWKFCMCLPLHAAAARAAPIAGNVTYANYMFSQQRLDSRHDVLLFYLK